MCGIVGYVGPRDATEIIVEGLHKLEYRGYDLAGIAVQENGTIHLRRAAGKLCNSSAPAGKRTIRGAAGHWAYTLGHSRRR